MPFSMKSISSFNEVYFKNKVPQKTSNDYVDNVTMIKFTEDEYLDLLLNYITEVESIIYYTTQLSITRNMETCIKISDEVKQQKLLDALKNMGWLEFSKANIKKGDINEYLMCIVIDIICEEVDTLVPKVSLKTSSNMAVHGDDNIFYNSKQNTLYFGESKMYKDFTSGLREACNSIKAHQGERFSWISTSTRTFNEIYGEKELVEQLELNTEYLQNVNKAVIIFISSESINPTYENHITKLKELKKLGYEVIAVHFPVISIDNLIENFFIKIGDRYGN